MWYPHPSANPAWRPASRYGTADRSLWVETLSYFAGKEEDCRDQIKEVLAHIDRRNLLPPLMVVDALARNSTATLAVVKDYITRRLSQENQNIAEDERLIRQYVFAIGAAYVLPFPGFAAPFSSVHPPGLLPYSIPPRSLDKQARPHAASANPMQPIRAARCQPRPGSARPRDWQYCTQF